MKIEVEQDIMQVNKRYAAENRALFAAHDVKAINILGSPGAGKTALLERLLSGKGRGMRAAVIEGDLATARDAERIAALGIPVVQINTDGGCHLDARMIAKTLPMFDLDQIDLLLIENVGNLVCPAAFDLGEQARLVVLSLAEGGDKPSKYPATFFSADAVALNKTDLLPYIDVDLEQVKADLRAIKPDIRIFEACCRANAESGMEQIWDYLAGEGKQGQGV